MSPANDGVSLLQVGLAFAAVAGLLALFGFGLRMVVTRGIKMPAFISPKTTRLQVVESLALDTRHRMMIVRCDRQEHVLVLGENQTTLLASNPAAETQP